MTKQRFCIYCGANVGKWKRVCGDCKVARRREIDRRYYTNNRERVLARQAATADERREYTRKWRAKNPDYRLRRILRKHGLLKGKAA